MLEKLTHAFIFNTILLPTGNQKRDILSFILNNNKINKELFISVLEKL